MWGQKPRANWPLIFLLVYVPDLITTCFKFGDDRFRGLSSVEGHILPFPIDFDGRPYNTLTLPCERVQLAKFWNSFFSPPKGTSLRRTTSYDVLSAKIGKTPFSMGAWKNWKKWSKHSKTLGVYFGYMGVRAKSPGRIELNLGEKKISPT